MNKEISARQNGAKALMKDAGLSALVLASAENVQYLTGVLEPSVQACGVFVISQQAEPVLAVMWLDKEAAQQETEDLALEAYTQLDRTTVIARILERLDATKGTVGMDNRAFEGMSSSLKRALPDVEFVNASKALDVLRSIKSDEEIRLIQRSCEIADTGMKAAFEALKPGITELEVAAIAEQQMVKLGSDKMKHHTVVASGLRTGLVHGFATHKKIEDGELVAIDLGAVYQGYCSDIARTFFIGKASDQVKRAVETMQKAQDAILRILKPGISIAEIEAVSQDVAGMAGYDLIGHVGHGIGLRNEEYPQLRSTGPDADYRFRKNSVVAFFQGSLQIKSNLGIRLEDTILLTESGAKTLTAFTRELL